MDYDMGVANIEGKPVENFQIRYKKDALTVILDKPPIWVVSTFNISRTWETGL